jgi:hypothetical protein
MVSIEIYVEGGGDWDDLKTRCRRGFKRFFEKAGLTGRLPKVIACGGRNSAFKMFRTAVSNRDVGIIRLILI